MRKSLFIVVILLSYALSALAQWNDAKWITVGEGNADVPNSWARYRKDVLIKSLPEQVLANICVDSKYWLYVNGKQVVFEGGLKRGPNPTDSYYDVVNLRPHLRKGVNSIEVLVWHFGKTGFSHIDSMSEVLLPPSGWSPIANGKAVCWLNIRNAESLNPTIV